MAISHPTQSKRFLRITGALYLSIAVIAPFAIFYVPSQLVIDGDPLATMENISAHRLVFLSGMAAESLLMLIEIALAVMLYHIFKPTHAVLSGIAALARAMEASVMAAMLFFSWAVLFLVDNATALEGFNAHERAGFVEWMLYIHSAGIWIWQQFFAFHLLILGFLVVRSGWLPKWIGYGLSIGSFGYLLDSVHYGAFAEVVALGFVVIPLLSVVTISELSFAIRLLLQKETRESS